MGDVVLDRPGTEEVLGLLGTGSIEKVKQGAGVFPAPFFFLTKSQAVYRNESIQPIDFFTRRWYNKTNLINREERHEKKVGPLAHLRGVDGEGRYTNL